MITMRGLALGAAFAVAVLAGSAFWLNTVNNEKIKAVSPEVMAAGNAYFLYKKEPSAQSAASVLRYVNTVQGRNYSILVLRDRGEYGQIGKIYQETMRTKNNSEVFQTFVYAIDVEVYYRQQLHGNTDASSAALSAMSESDRSKVLECYTTLRERYSYPWVSGLVPYFGRPLENFDNFFNIRSASCQ